MLPLTVESASSPVLALPVLVSVCSVCWLHGSFRGALRCSQSVTVFYIKYVLILQVRVRNLSPTVPVF